MNEITPGSTPGAVLNTTTTARADSGASALNDAPLTANPLFETILSNIVDGFGKPFAATAKLLGSPEATSASVLSADTGAVLPQDAGQVLPMVLPPPPVLLSTPPVTVSDQGATDTALAVAQSGQWSASMTATLTKGMRSGASDALPVTSGTDTSPTIFSDALRATTTNNPFAEISKELFTGGMRDARTQGDMLSVAPNSNGGVTGFLSTLMTATPVSSDGSSLMANAAAHGTAVNSSLIASDAIIRQPVGAPGWGQELGGRVTWMVSQNVQSAEIHITPPQLGPIEVRIAIQNDQATVTLSAQHVLTREALEAALPRLRDMLSDSGINLANVNVSQHSFNDQNGRRQQDFTPQFGADENAVTEQGGFRVVQQQRLGMVDYYA